MEKRFTNIHTEVLFYKYGKIIEEWRAEEEHDDRRLAINIYDQLIEAYNYMEEKQIDNICIKVALNKKSNEDEKMIRKIIKRFEGGLK